MMVTFSVTLQCHTPPRQDIDPLSGGFFMPRRLVEKGIKREREEKKRREKERKERRGRVCEKKEKKSIEREKKKRRREEEKGSGVGAAAYRLLP